MSLLIERPGLQTTLQGAPRRGYRHMGVPWSGPADAVSMALANRLVGNGPEITALEVTMGGFLAKFTEPAWIALSGAPAPARRNGQPISHHSTLHLNAGDLLELAPPARGMRTYLAIAGGFTGEMLLGSASTYLPARLGGHEGRALQKGDKLELASQPDTLETRSTPNDHRPHIASSHVLRAVSSAETHLLSAASETDLFQSAWTASRAASRMGVRLEGPKLDIASDGQMHSAAVFPGILQCAEDGQPIALMADGQTTGGYPRIAAILACDLHLLGQIRPGDTIKFLKRDLALAETDNRRKADFLRSWLQP